MICIKWMINETISLETRIIQFIFKIYDEEQRFINNLVRMT